MSIPKETVHRSLTIIMEDIVADFRKMNPKRGLPFEVHAERELLKRRDLGDITQGEADMIFNHLLETLPKNNPLWF
jgi:hypothetical protein